MTLSGKIQSDGEGEATWRARGTWAAASLLNVQPENRALNIKVPLQMSPTRWQIGMKGKRSKPGPLPGCTVPLITCRQGLESGSLKMSLKSMHTA